MTTKTECEDRGGAEAATSVCESAEADASVAPDAMTPREDASAPADGSAPADAGVEEDASALPDAGELEDAAQAAEDAATPDAGVEDDAGEAPDAGSGTDAGGAMDGGPTDADAPGPQDVGTPDAGDSDTGPVADGGGMAVPCNPPAVMWTAANEVGAVLLPSPINDCEAGLFGEFIVRSFGDSFGLEVVMTYVILAASHGMGTGMDRTWSFPPMVSGVPMWAHIRQDSSNREWVIYFTATLGVIATMTNVSVVEL